MRNLQRCLFATVVILACGCSKNAEREWQPQDHDHEEELASAPAPLSSGTALADSLWSNTCAPCHGPGGAGDGAMGKTLRVPNLADMAWQSRTSDEQITTIIREGRGRMPAFPLSDEKASALVGKIRSFKPNP